MRKPLIGIGILVLVQLVMISYTIASDLNFNYGQDTYEKWDDNLVVNSLGDETTVSQYGSLGTNDWIPENAYKNLLKYEGYTSAYDYNPQANYTWGVYNQPLPTKDLTKLEFGGLQGDPRATQYTYVSTEEYNRLSAPEQAKSIDNLNTNLTKETVNRIDGDNILSDKVGEVDNKHTNWNNNQDKKITNIQGVNDRQDATLRDHENRINDLDNRVDELEETQINIDGEVIFQRGRRYSIGAYGKYDMRHNRVPEVGIRVSIALEDSYEMKEIDKLNKKIDKMNRQTELSNIETEIVVENGKIITRIKR
jgi:hypothetical protein